VIDEALTVATQLAALAKATEGPLTQREQEVAGLIAHGLTNRHIAEQLVISPQTAHRNVSNIMDKLGLATRGEVAAWGVVPGASSMTAGSG
jgi:DNA-binding NarL/FixJ family response regulator